VRGWQVQLPPGCARLVDRSYRSIGLKVNDENASPARLRKKARDLVKEAIRSRHGMVACHKPHLNVDDDQGFRTSLSVRHANIMLTALGLRLG
jgi:hypothetical protein